MKSGHFSKNINELDGTYIAVNGRQDDNMLVMMVNSLDCMSECSTGSIQSNSTLTVITLES